MRGYSCWEEMEVPENSDMESPTEALRSLQERKASRDRKWLETSSKSLDYPLNLLL